MTKIYDVWPFYIGNVISQVQISRFLRPKSAVVGSSQIGECQQYDIRTLASAPYIPHGLILRACSLANQADASVIVYCIRHFNGKKAVVKGYAITDANQKLLYRSIENSPHAARVMQKALAKITAH